MGYIAKESPDHNEHNCYQYEQGVYFFDTLLLLLFNMFHYEI